VFYRMAMLLMTLSEPKPPKFLHFCCLSYHCN